MELGKIHRQAFERVLWAGAADAAAAEAAWPNLGSVATAKLQRALSDAWRAGDQLRLVAIGRVLSNRRKLDHIAAARVRRTLLRLGADPDIRDHRFGGTPLGWARYFGQQALIDLLEPLTVPDQDEPPEVPGGSS